MAKKEKNKEEKIKKKIKEEKEGAEKTESKQAKPENEEKKELKKEKSKESPVSFGQNTEEEKVSKLHKKHKIHIKKRGKKYKGIAKLIDKNQFYSPEEALDLALKTSTTKFDASVEIHIRLGIKTGEINQNIRTTADLPEGIGKTIKIAAIVSSSKEKEAKEAGADFTGSDDLISKIEKGFLDFDVVIATPDMMAKIGKLGKILGTKGLMPNPKTETVTTNPGEIITKIKKGRVELKNDTFGIIHASFGKISFGKEKLILNLQSLYKTLLKAKPQQVKGQFIKGISISTTMGPSIKIDIDKMNKLIQKTK